MISEPDIYIIHYTHYGVCLKAAYGSDKYAIYVCPDNVLCVCVSQLAVDCISDTFEHRGVLVHCCVPIAYYRMARTIRFHSRSPRYFRRGSPISLRRLIRRSIGRDDGKDTRAYSILDVQ